MKGKILTITSISHFINDGNTWFLPITFTYLIIYLGLTKLLIGILSGVFFFGISALSAPLVSRLADKTRNYSRLMGFGILLWGLSLILFGFSLELHSVPLVFLSVALAGFSSTFYHPLGGALLSITFQGSAGFALGINGSMGSLGRALYPTITLILFAVLHNDMTLASIILGIVSLAASLPAFFIKLEDPKVKEEKKQVNQMNKTTYSVITLLTVTALFRSMFGQGISQFLPTLLVEDFGYSYNVNLGEIISIALASAVIGQPILGLLSDKFGRRLLYAISTFGSAISVLAFLKFPNEIFLIIFGFFNFSAFPLMLSLVGDYVPRNSSGFANSLVWGLGVTGGGAIGPIIVGVISQFTNLIFASELVSIMAFIAVILTVVLPKPPKRTKVPLFA